MAHPTSTANRMCTQVLMLTASALLATGVLAAQSSMPNQQPNNGANSSMSGMQMGGSSAAAMSSASPQDMQFAKKALAGGMAEVQLGQLAQQKSNSDDVKKFGQTMVDDHTKLNDQMKPIAASIGVQPPMELMPKEKELMTKLQALSGDAFDKAYIKAMVKDHKEDDKEFQMEATMGQNQQEKDAAMQGDQIIKQHLQMVMDLAKAHNVPEGGSKAM